MFTADDLTRLAKACGGNSAGLMQPVIEAWLYRLVKHDRVTALAAVFSAMQTLMAAETDKTALLGNFLQEWRVAASTASAITTAFDATVLYSQASTHTRRRTQKNGCNCNRFLLGRYL